MKAFLISLVVFLSTISDFIAQDSYYLDCPVSKQMFPISGRYDSINIFSDDVRRSENNIAYPIVFGKGYNRLLNRNKLTHNSYRIILSPSQDFSQFLVSSFSRNYCFVNEDDTNRYVTLLNEYTDLAHSISYNPFDRIEIHPLFNVWLRDYLELNKNDITLIENTIVNSVQNNLMDYIDYYLPPNQNTYTLINSFYVAYNTIDNYKFIKNKIGMYLDENPLYYSMPNKEGERLSPNSIRYKCDSAFINKDSLIISCSKRAKEIGLKFPITIEPFLLNEKTESDKVYNAEIFNSSYSNFGFKIVNKYIGVVYLNEKNVSETLWILKDNLYSTLKDKTFENMLEMILKNKIINKISHDNY